MAKDKGKFDWKSLLMLMGGGAKGLPAGLNMMRGKKAEADAEKLKSQTNQQFAEETGMPTYQMPEGVKNALAMYQTQARADLPGADVMRQDYARGLAMSLNAGKNQETPFGRMSVQGSALDRYNQNIERLGAQAAQYRAGNQNQLAGFYAGPYAQQEQNQFQYNEMLPYSTRMNRYWAEKQSGRDQTNQGIDQYASYGSDIMNMFSGNIMQGWSPQQGVNQQSQQYQPYPYSQNFTNQMNQMGQNQVAPARALGSDPYSGGYTPPTTNLPRN